MQVKQVVSKEEATASAEAGKVKAIKDECEGDLAEAMPLLEVSAPSPLVGSPLVDLCRVMSRLWCTALYIPRAYVTPDPTDDVPPLPSSFPPFPPIPHRRRL